MLQIKNHQILLILLYLTSCTEEFPLKTQANEEFIVLEGAITNEQGPYFFSLRKSQSINSSANEYSSISNAIVVIRDNTGVIDTLRSLSPEVFQHQKWGYYYTTFFDYNEIEDTIKLNSSFSKQLEGIYYTTKIQGIPGNTYSLSINYENKIISAEEQMPLVPNIDSIKFRPHLSDKEENTSFLVPYLYFKEPQDEINYYMFNFGNDQLINMLSGTAQVWQFSILSDEFLPEYINGINIDDGASPVGSQDFFYVTSGDSVIIRMLSLSESAYIYYQNLLAQFENDGGAYTPSPTSPVSNLSEGGLGYFRVSAVSEKRLIVE